MGGEIVYYKYFRKDRNEEIQREKEDDDKLRKFVKMEMTGAASVEGEEDKTEADEETVKNAKQAQDGRSLWFKSREQYK